MGRMSPSIATIVDNMENEENKTTNADFLTTKRYSKNI